MFTAFTPVLHAFFSVNKNYSVLVSVRLSLLLSVLESVLLALLLSVLVSAPLLNLDLGISIFSFLYAASTAYLIHFAYAFAPAGSKCVSSASKYSS